MHIIAKGFVGWMKALDIPNPFFGHSHGHEPNGFGARRFHCAWFRRCRYLRTKAGVYCLLWRQPAPRTQRSWTICNIIAIGVPVAVCPRAAWWLLSFLSRSNVCHSRSRFRSSRRLRRTGSAQGPFPDCRRAKDHQQLRLRNWWLGIVRKERGEKTTFSR